MTLKAIRKPLPRRLAVAQEHSYCAHMTRNITLSVEDSVLKEVRRIAVEQDTTVNGLVRRYSTNSRAKRKSAKKRDAIS